VRPSHPRLELIHFRIVDEPRGHHARAMSLDLKGLQTDGSAMVRIPRIHTKNSAQPQVASRAK
jgi:hypothetical protein